MPWRVAAELSEGERRTDLASR